MGEPEESAWDAAEKFFAAFELQKQIEHVRICFLLSKNQPPPPDYSSHYLKFFAWLWAEFELKKQNNSVSPQVPPRPNDPIHMLWWQRDQLVEQMMNGPCFIKVEKLSQEECQMLVQRIHFQPI